MFQAATALLHGQTHVLFETVSLSMVGIIVIGHVYRSGYMGNMTQSKQGKHLNDAVERGKCLHDAAE